MKVEQYFCDINDCKKECKSQQEKLQVIFTTEQTEGRGCNPYLDTATINICDACKEKVLQGMPIFAYGAQGYNTYILRENGKA